MWFTKYDKVDIMNLLKTLGYKEGSINLPQDFVYEKSFVNKL